MNLKIENQDGVDLNLKLEAELAQKTDELHHCYQFIKELTDISKLSLMALNALEAQLKSTQELLAKSTKQNEVVFARLMNENNQLKSSNDAWTARALKFESQLMVALHQVSTLEQELALSNKKATH